MTSMGKVVRFVKKEIVFCVSLILAVVSMFFVHPDSGYATYIDFRTLVILWMLMIIMAGVQKQHVFNRICEKLLYRINNLREVVLVLLCLCFFSSMLITNDVALITFVPFSIIILSMCNKKEYLIIVIVLETVAANLGSMLTPLGNPQNLYLYSLSGMDFAEFVGMMLPFAALSFFMIIVVAVKAVKPQRVTLIKKGDPYSVRKHKKIIIMYMVLFVLALFVVLRIVDYRIGFAVVLACCLIFDRETLKKPDYMLLMTFVFLFIFIGNIKRVPEISLGLQQIISGNETLVSAGLSQVISNVPAAILCGGFAGDIPALVVGVNLGGLGTLIASMASLISFKQYTNMQGARTGRYVLAFTVLNAAFLAVLLLFDRLFVGVSA